MNLNEYHNWLTDQVRKEREDTRYGGARSFAAALEKLNEVTEFNVKVTLRPEGRWAMLRAEITEEYYSLAEELKDAHYSGTTEEVLEFEAKLCEINRVFGMIARLEQK